MFSASSGFGSSSSGFGGGAAKDLFTSTPPQGRASIGGNRSTGGGGERRDGPAELPCIAATLGLLQRAAEKGNIEAGKCVLYDDVQCGVVSVVGWVVSNEHLDDEQDARFSFADGTLKSPVIVHVDIRSEEEAWLRPFIREILKTGNRVRVIGVASASDETIVIRSVNVQPATVAESCYYHTVEVVHSYLATTKKLSKIGDKHGGAHVPNENMETANGGLGFPSEKAVTDKKTTDGSLAVPSMAGPVELPPRFSDVTTLCQRAVVRHILDFGEDGMGCRQSDLAQGLKPHYSGEDVAQALEALVNDGNAFETLAGYFDVLPDAE